MSTVRLCFAYSEMPLLPAGAFSFIPDSGCRIGEALALTASDIDTVNRRISITKTYFRHKGKDEITEPKTRESVRTVIIPEFLVEELKEYMASMYKLPADERIFAVVPEIRLTSKIVTVFYLHLLCPCVLLSCRDYLLSCKSLLRR